MLLTASLVNGRSKTHGAQKSAKKATSLMDDDWFNEYLFKVVVKKQYVPEKLVKIWEGEATPVEAWDSMA